MARKPAKMYTQVKGKAYTRREYMGGVPGSRLLIWDMGNKRGDFPIVLSLVAKEQCQVRHTALEAARIVANRTIQKKAGQLGYHLKIRVYPHHILRENKIATGAGADRVSDGMRHAFGKAIGRAARIVPGQKLMTLGTNPVSFLHAKDALRKASMKFPTPCTILIEKGADLIPS